MKTELVVKMSYGTQEPRFERSTLVEGEATKGRRLRYIPAHTAKGSRSHPTTGRAQTQWHELEAVITRNYIFHPKGGKLDPIRRMPQEWVVQLEALDETREDLQRQIYELNKREREILAAVFDKSEPLRMHEIRGFKS